MHGIQRKQRLIVVVTFLVSLTASFLSTEALIATTNKRRKLSLPVLRSSQTEDQQPSRRKFIKGLAHLTTGIAFTTAVLTTTDKASAYSYQQAYPLELDDKSGDIRSAREAVVARKRATRDASMDYVTDKNPLFFRGTKDIFTSAAWGGALWLLGGSRSNPLVTPLANLIYDAKTEQWLKDRNDGLFATLPLSLFGVLAIVFFLLGIATDRFILLLAEGSASVSLQLAGVTLIGAASLELGRLASGEKLPTREEYDRQVQLVQDFDEFADNRLKPSGNCHRSDVVKAFRRYYGKYRQPDIEGYELTDLEIERLLKRWNALRGYAEMTSGGFYNGISINQDADAFV